MSATTTPSRRSRALAFRRIVPSMTMQPAMTPILELRKMSRISAWPRTFSSKIGFSMPFRAASTSSMAA